MGSVPPPRLRASVADITHQQAGPHPAKSTQGRRMVLAQCIGQAVPIRLAQGIKATHIGVSYVAEQLLLCDLLKVSP